MTSTAELSISVVALRLLDVRCFTISIQRQSSASAGQRAKVAPPSSSPAPPAAAKSDLTAASVAARQAASVSVAISETLINH